MEDKCLPSDLGSPFVAVSQHLFPAMRYSQINFRTLDGGAFSVFDNISAVLIISTK